MKIRETVLCNVEVKEPDEDLRYGWGNFRPTLLQVLNNPKFFTITVSFFSFIQGMSVNGFTNIFLLTLERRFHLTSTEVGFIAASNDIAGIVLTSLVSFYGTYGNKIKWLGYGSVVTVGRYEPILGSNGFANGEICRMGGNATSGFCFGQYGGEWYYIFIFFLGQLLMGAGTTPLYTLGPAYIDENVHPKSSPVYLAVFFSLTLLGPGLGFISGGSLLNIYIDITRPEGSNLAPNDPQWIGAWWLGYVAGGSILVIISGLLLGFPRELPGAKRIREEAQKEGVLPKKDEKIKGSVKDILPATLQLLKTPVFIFNTLAVSSGSLFGAGIASFLAKILQLKFGISPFITGVVIGTILVPGTVGGVLVGGFLVRRFDLKRSLKMAARFCVIASFFTLAGSGAWFVPGCGVPDLVGVTVPHKGSSALQGSKVTLSCNVNCSCSQASINPTFANCGCISSQGNSSTRSAVKGYCTKRSGCKTYLAFILLLVVVLFSVFITAIANKTVVLRCVAYNQRAYALGVQFIIQRSIGFLPGPLMFGAIFDSTCMLWGQSCGRRGNCLFNDMEVLTDRLGYTAIGFTGIAFLFYFLSFWFCKETIQEEERSKHKQSFKDEEEGLKENDAEEKH
ncbi:Solute carrier organic anion transporter family member 4A1, partial [Acropora cervicornis]